MSFSIRRRSWDREPNAGRGWKPPCGLLINNKQCLDPSCESSHDSQLVRKWQNGRDETKTCRWREDCYHMHEGMCIYWHPPEHQLARPAAMTFGLERLEQLDLDTLLADRDVYIQDRGDLASFNKLADDEIIVPGSPPFFSPITRRTEILLDAENHDLTPRFPRYTYTFEPLLRALEVSSPSFNLFETTNMVSNASNLRKLFHIFQ
ncbi:hypothetical protein B0H67DRAFT_498300, partial [Lasiosphaeris hirsuta]